MSKSRGNVVDPWDVIAAHGADAFRWYYLTAQQPWAGYRFSVDTVGESVRQFLLTLWNTYSFWVLYANAEGLEPGDFSAAPGAGRATSTAGRSRGCRRRRRRCASAWTTSTAPPPARRSPSTSRSSPTGTCGSRAAASGTATAPPSRPCATACWRPRRMLAPFTPFLADEIHLNLAGGAAEELGELPDSVHLRDFPEVDDALADPAARGGDGGGPPHGRARPRRPRPGEGEGAPAAAPRRDRRQRRRARRDRSRAPALVTAELNVKELDFVTDEAELVSYAVKPNYRSLGPRFGKRMPQVAAAVEALDPAHVAEVMGERRRGRDQRRRRRAQPSAPTSSPSPCSRSRATRSRPKPATPSPCSSSSTTSCAARASPARSSTPSRTPARRRASRSPTASTSSLGGDPELLEAAREHEAYLTGEVLATSVDLRRRRRRRDGERSTAASSASALHRAGSERIPARSIARHCVRAASAALLACLALALPAAAPAAKPHVGARAASPGPAPAAHPRRLLPLRGPALRSR